MEIQSKTTTQQELDTTGDIDHQEDMKEIRIFNIFSGTGSIKIVLKEITRNLRITGEIVSMCENNNDLRIRLQYDNPQTKMITDATNINWDEVPQFNVLTASPP